MKITKILAFTLVSTVIISCGKQFNKVDKLENEIDSVSYAVGLNLATQMKKNFAELNEDAFAQAIKDGMDSTNLKMDPAKVQAIIRPYFAAKRQKEIQEQQVNQKKNAEANFADNKKAGEDFLAANKSKPGVKTTPSGLQYIVMKEGKGDLVKPTDKVKIHYHGTTITGEVFDSTVEKGKPYESTANIFVTGFNEALAMMKKGSKHKVFIPQELAYEYRQRGALIKPFSALIFEIEIVDILTK